MVWVCCVALCRVVVCRCGVCSKFSWVPSGGPLPRLHPPPPDRPKWGFTRQPKNSKRAHLRVPTFREKKRMKTVVGEGKKARNFGPPTLRSPTHRDTSLPKPSAGPPSAGQPSLFLGCCLCCFAPDSAALLLFLLLLLGRQPSTPLSSHLCSV